MNELKLPLTINFETYKMLWKISVDKNTTPCIAASAILEAFLNDYDKQRDHKPV